MSLPPTPGFSTATVQKVCAPALALGLHSHASCASTPLRPAARGFTPVPSPPTRRSQFRFAPKRYRAAQDEGERPLCASPGPRERSKGIDTVPIPMFLAALVHIGYWCLAVSLVHNAGTIPNQQHPLLLATAHLLLRLFSPLPPPPPLVQALPCLSTGTRLTVVFLTFSVACARGRGDCLSEPTLGIPWFVPFGGRRCARTAFSVVLSSGGAGSSFNMRHADGSSPCSMMLHESNRYQVIWCTSFFVQCGIFNPRREALRVRHLQSRWGLRTRPKKKPLLLSVDQDWAPTYVGPLTGICGCSPSSPLRNPPPPQLQALQPKDSDEG